MPSTIAVKVPGAFFLKGSDKAVFEVCLAARDDDVVKILQYTVQIHGGHWVHLPHLLMRILYGRGEGLASYV